MSARGGRGRGGGGWALGTGQGRTPAHKPYTSPSATLLWATEGDLCNLPGANIIVACKPVFGEGRTERWCGGQPSASRGRWARWRPSPAPALQDGQRGAQELVLLLLRRLHSTIADQMIVWRGMGRVPKGVVNPDCIREERDREERDRDNALRHHGVAILQLQLGLIQLGPHYC
jgi:hypothetical protein